MDIFSTNQILKNQLVFVKCSKNVIDKCEKVFILENNFLTYIYLHFKN